MTGPPTTPPPAAETVVIDPGTGAPIRPARGDGGVRRPLLTLGLLAAALGLVAVVASLTLDDPPPEPAPPRLGMFDLDRVNLPGSPSADETAFPLFGREWGQTMLFAQRLGIVAVDLDTGDQRIWLPRDDGFAPGGWNGVSFVGDIPYVTFGWGGVARVEDGGLRTVVAESEPGLRWGGVYGEYGLRLGVDDRGELAFDLRHLPTGAAVDIEFDDVRRFAVVDGEILVDRDGTIHRRGPDGPERDWARGELSAAGPDAVVWRECDPDCSTWAGTVDDPRALGIDESFDLAIGRRRPELWLGSFTLPVLSPGGRYAPAIADTARGLPGLIDLVDGDAVITGPHLGWTEDLSAAVTVIEPTIAFIDTATGEVARIPLLEGAGARKGTMVTLVPTDELPEITTIE